MKNGFFFKCLEKCCFNGIEIEIEEPHVGLQRNVVKTCKWPEKLDPIIEEEEEDDDSEVEMREEVYSLEAFINHDDTEENVEEEEDVHGALKEKEVEEMEQDVVNDLIIEFGMTPCTRQQNSAVQMFQVIMYWIAFTGGFGVSCVFGKRAMQIGRFFSLANFIGALFYLVLREESLLKNNALEETDDDAEMQKGSKFGSQEEELASQRMSIGFHSESINRRQYVPETEIKSANDESAITTLMETGSVEEMIERMSIDAHSESVNEVSETLTLAQRLEYELQLEMSTNDFTNNSNGIDEGADLPKENRRSLSKRTTKNETKKKDDDLKTEPVNSNKIYGCSLFGKTWKRSRNYGSRCLKSIRNKHRKLVLCL